MSELKQFLALNTNFYYRLTPCGVSELKLLECTLVQTLLCLTPCGVSELKHQKGKLSAVSSCLTPCGVSELKLFYQKNKFNAIMSHPVWGEWIETFHNVNFSIIIRLTPCGVSELKQFEVPCKFYQMVSPRVGWVNWNDRSWICFNVERSHPVWGEWIETIEDKKEKDQQSLTPCGVSELKQFCYFFCFTTVSLTPCGVSELKLEYENDLILEDVSHPHAGWVNWNDTEIHDYYNDLSHPHAGWVNWNKTWY